MEITNISCDLINKLNCLQDEISSIATCHIYIEQLINVIISKEFKIPDSICKLRFSQKIDLIYGLEIINEKILHDLKKFNKLRNKYAHEFNYSFGDEFLIFNVTSQMEQNLKTLKDDTNRIKMIGCFIYAILHNLLITKYKIPYNLDENKIKSDNTLAKLTFDFK